MRRLWILLPLLLLACNPAVAGQQTIRSVTFTHTTGTVSPQYWRKWTLAVNRNLRTHYTETDFQNKVLQEKRGKTTQAQFGALAKALDAAHYTTAKSTPLNPMPLGGGSSTLTVQTDKGRYGFNGPSTYAFPPAIGKVFDLKDKFMP